MTEDNDKIEEIYNRNIEKAKEFGVEILPGIAGDKVLFNEDGSVGGVITGDMGIAIDGKPTFRSAKRTPKSAATSIFIPFHSLNCCYWSPEGLKLCANKRYLLAEKALTFIFYAVKSYLDHKVMFNGSVGVSETESAGSGGTNTGGGISSETDDLNIQNRAQKAII